MTRVQSTHLRECSDPDICLTCIILNPDHRKLEPMKNGWKRLTDTDLFGAQYSDRTEWSEVHEGYYVNGRLIKFRVI